MTELSVKTRQRATLALIQATNLMQHAAITLKSCWILVNMQLTCFQVSMNRWCSLEFLLFSESSLNTTSNTGAASIFVSTARQTPQPLIRTRSNYRLGHLREIQIPPTGKQHLTPGFDICIISPWRRIDITSATFVYAEQGEPEGCQRLLRAGASACPGIKHGSHVPLSQQPQMLTPQCAIHTLVSGQGSCSYTSTFLSSRLPRCAPERPGTDSSN